MNEKENFDVEIDINKIMEEKLKEVTESDLKRKPSDVKVVDNLKIKMLDIRERVKVDEEAENMIRDNHKEIFENWNVFMYVRSNLFGKKDEVKNLDDVDTEIILKLVKLGVSYESLNKYLQLNEFYKSLIMSRNYIVGYEDKSLEEVYELLLNSFTDFSEVNKVIDDANGRNKKNEVDTFRE